MRNTTPLLSLHYPAIRLRARGTEDAGNSLVRDKDLPAVHDLRERDRGVLLPVLYRLGAFDEDDEVVIRALVVHFGLLVVSTRHVGGL